jgi:pimeloyl-ACP methyl ester carboxylesterase
MRGGAPGDLPAALCGDRVELDTGAGRVSVYVAGQGPALVLIHSVNAVASAAEMRPLHERYRASRTVFSLDLPGYGHSARDDCIYTPQLMTAAVHAVTKYARARAGDLTIDALALSLSAEFLARAAAEDPASYRSIALVSPTGFRGRKPLRGPAGATRAIPGLYRALRGPNGRRGRALFGFLTRPKVIRYFLRRTWGSQDIDAELWHYDILTARIEGAEFAPLYFLSGGLFSRDIFGIYEGLRPPVWMSHGVRGDFTDYRLKDRMLGRGNWRCSVFATGALPYFERLDDFGACYDEFLREVATM